ncbi:uncharacterized protein LOC124896692 [Capsicum annuum]|uniref:uncharacterized protein LOC124896692 n=1 Tax=Capsicum annuum TaxID=4072 RepID=UPI001FB05540|nr:uncharacterized protein LOC124896692 [Capsicum annuum]
MARGRGRGSTGRGGKSAVRSNNDVTANIPTIPTLAIVTSQANVIASSDGSNHTTPESSPTALNQFNRTREGTATLRNQIDINQGRGTGRGSIGGAGKSAARTNMHVRTTNIPTIPTPTVTPQTAGGVGSPTSNHCSTYPTTPNQTNPKTVGTSSQTNQVGEDISLRTTNGESNSSQSHVRTLVTITSVGIHESFKSELDDNGVNWKSVSCDIKDGYFGEFKKNVYWDFSITDAVVKKHWQSKATTVYRNFIAKIKEKGGKILYKKISGKRGSDFAQIQSVLKSPK